MPKKNPVNINAHVIFFAPKKSNITMLIRCAAPDSANNFPIMAPARMTINNEPNVSPIPFWIDNGILASGIPNIKPTTTDTMINAIKGLNLTHEINKTNNKMAKKIIKKSINYLYKI